MSDPCFFQRIPLGLALGGHIEVVVRRPGGDVEVFINHTEGALHLALPPRLTATIGRTCTAASIAAEPKT